MRHFTISELCASDTARRLGIDNTPAPDVRANLERLVTLLLDPLRQSWGEAITVSSGYRCPRLNAAVGGVPSSAHLLGHAADLRPSRPERMAEFKRFVRRWLASTGTPFDQFIDERSPAGAEWVHLARCNRNGAQRRQML